MDSRKIQKSVSGSYIVTLPKEWVEKYGFGKGERVGVVVNEEGILSLVPNGAGANPPKECFLSFEEYPTSSAIQRRVKACYMEGDDIITVTSKKTLPQEVKGDIKAAAGELIGMEVSEDFASRVVLRTLVDPMRFPVRELMKRIYVLASAMEQDSVQALRESDRELAGDVIAREREVDKLSRLMLRQLMIASNRVEIARALGIKDLRSIVVAAMVARTMNRIAWYAADIARQTLAIGDPKTCKPPEDLYRLSEAAREMLEGAMAAYFTEDFQMANGVIDRMEEIREMDTRIEEQVIRGSRDPGSAIALTRVSRDLRRIGIWAADVAESTLIRIDGNE
ncbi:MAG: AbrB/MazE/SpoVT family DNA-binding domain-containing protein [Euryarchaeota archaeon]|nr:AbrB/MazE/SpoVT family DNA-binding domain-containing protein [Euryarchaeota archaeon]